MNIYVINVIYERDMQRSGRNADRTRGSTTSKLHGSFDLNPRELGRTTSAETEALDIFFCAMALPPLLPIPLSVYLDFRALKSAPTLPFSGGTPITRGWRVVLLIGAMLERARRREGDTSWVNC